MKKRFFAALVMLLMLSLAFSVYSARYIDPEINEKLNSLYGKSGENNLSNGEIKEEGIKEAGVEGANIQGVSGAEEEISVIVKLKEGATDKNKVKEESGFIGKYDYQAFNGFSGKIKADELQTLIDDNDVDAVFYDRVYYIDMSDTKGLTNATKVWPLLFNGVNLTGKGQTACILDTGINYSHANLGSTACNPANFAGSCGRVIGGYDYCADDISCSTEDADPYDKHGHGTHVAGTIASNASDYTGMAPEGNVAMIKVCNSTGACFTSAILSGFDWCTSNRSVFNISVISMSIGGGSSSTYCDSNSSFTSSINSATLVNISVVVAAGNDGSSNSISSPACVENATAVSAVDKTDAIASYSNRANITDLFAFGSSINSTSKTGGFESMSGTSMATPHVAGAILLLQQYKLAESGRMLTVAEALAALNNTGKRIYDSATGLNYSRILVYDALIATDAAAPQLNLTEPRNATYYSNVSLSLNYSALDIVLGTTWYNLDNGANVSLTGNITFNVSYGVHTLTLFANDSRGNINITNVNFSASSMFLTLVLNNPANTSYTTRNILVNVSVDGFAVNKWFSNGTGNITYNSAAYANFSEGFNQFVFYANNSNVTNSTNINFTVDSIQPYVAFSNLVSGGYYSYNIFINITNNSDAVNRWLFNGSANASYNIPLYINLSEGDYNLIAYANDSLGNINSTMLTIHTDLTAPTVSVNSPAADSYYNSNLLVNISVTDTRSGVNSTSVYYRWENASLNGSWIALTNVSSLFTATFDLSSVFEGAYTLRFNASDVLNNSGVSVTTTFTKDTIKPYVLSTGNVSSSGVTASAATITFTSSENANATINYGTTTAMTSRYNDASFGTSHSNSLSGLTASSLYYYNVTYCDRAGNCNSSSTSNFTTSAAVVVSESTGPGGGGGGGAAANPTLAGTVTQVWASMIAGQTYDFLTGKPDFAVQKISITPDRALSDVQVVVRQLTAKPASVLREPANVYSYFEIAKVNLINSDLRKAVISFSVDKSWVDSHGKKEDITGMRYVSDKWEVLSTRYISEANGKYNYESDTLGFSYFAIAVKSAVNSGAVKSASNNVSIGENNISSVTISPGNETKAVDIVAEVSKSLKGYWWVWVIIFGLGVGAFLAYRYAGRIVRE